VRSQQRGLGWGTDLSQRRHQFLDFACRSSTKTQDGPARRARGANPKSSSVVRSRPIRSSFQCPVRDGLDRAAPAFQPEDAAGLRTYLLKGGFLWVDDFWGPWAWEAFIDEIAKALPPVSFPKGDHRRASDLQGSVSDRENAAGAVDAVLAHERRLDSEMDEYSTNAHMARSSTSRAASWC
jgi:hypothetical protein